GTQTAFTPLGIVNGDVTLNQPQDLFIRDGLIYVADSSNKRIAVLDYAGNLVQEIGVDTLENPTGVFVNEEGFVYVADKNNALVYKFDADGDLVRTFERPVEPLFGTASLYIPVKIVVGAGENIYVVGDGSTSGVIQLNYDGSFLGYFGVNLSNKSLLQKIAEVFVQGDVYAANVPPSPTNIAINIKSLVYTATPNTENALKKLDVNGNNVLTTVNYYPSQDVVDLTVNDAGYLYAIYDDGVIVEYDPAGNLLFAFDVVTGTQDILGLVGRPTGIAIDESGYLFVLDAGNGANNGEIAVYAPTAFATLVHGAIDMYNSGDYLESTSLFEAILRQNANFALAHSALGKAYFQNGMYEEALAEYRLASDVAGYSETYWKIRDGWLKENLSWVFIVLISLFAGIQVIRLINRKTPVFAGINQTVKTVANDRRVKRFTLLFQMLKHPINGFYEIKRLRRASYGSAALILVVIFIEYLVAIRFTGFVFNTYATEINLLGEAAKFFGLFFLFVFANYLIATLADGEGWFRDVFVAAAYALAPMAIFLLPIVALSNVLTQNEEVVYQLLSTVMYGWTTILVFLAVKEIHNYEIKETVKNLLMTIFTVIIIVLIGFILYVFGAELFDFVASWIKEAINRVLA
ncbi:MAG: YIP1 family protein, partial [bacterium]